MDHTSDEASPHETAPHETAPHDTSPHKTVLFQAEAFDEIGQPNRAIELLGPAIAADPTNVELLTALASTLSSADRDAEAREAALAVLSIDADNDRATWVMAWSAIRLGDSEAALHYARALLERRPHEPTAHMALAWAWAVQPEVNRYVRTTKSKRAHRNEMRERSRAAYRESLELGATAWAFENAARIERRFFNSRAAGEHIAAGLELDPQNVALLRLNAHGEAFASDKAEAFGNLLAANPQDVASQHSIAQIFRHKRRGTALLRWAVPVMLLATAALTGGWGTGVAFAIVWGVTFLVVSVSYSALNALPGGYTLMRRSRLRGRRLILVTWWVWFVCAFVGSIRIAVGDPGGLVMLAIACATWVLEESILLPDDVRWAGQDDESAAAFGVDADARAQFDVSRSLRSMVTPLILAAAAGVAALLHALGVGTPLEVGALLLVLGGVSPFYSAQAVVFVSRDMRRTGQVHALMWLLVGLGWVLGAAVICGGVLLVSQ